MCWLAATKGAGSVDGSDHNSVWWCHGCKKWFTAIGTKQIETDRRGRYPMHIV
jgi:hypothetical protein